jgi:hypothetical protein
MQSIRTPRTNPAEGAVELQKAAAVSPSVIPEARLAAVTHWEDIDLEAVAASDARRLTPGVLADLLVIARQSFGGPRAADTSGSMHVGVAVVTALEALAASEAFEDALPGAAAAFVADVWSDLVDATTNLRFDPTDEAAAREVAVRVLQCLVVLEHNLVVQESAHVQTAALSDALIAVAAAHRNGVPKAQIEAAVARMLEQTEVSPVATGPLASSDS